MSPTEYGGLIAACSLVVVAIIIMLVAKLFDLFELSRQTQDRPVNTDFRDWDADEFDRVWADRFDTWDNR